MYHSIRRNLPVGSIAAVLIALMPWGARATEDQTTTRHVDLAIALDVSGSMDGLIDSAKQRLWDITNELARAQPQPELRVAILSYGNPDYGIDTGFVRIDQPFTSDLDAVNQSLFAFQTNGGDEYVARAVHTSVTQLQWSNDPDALRIIFVAGNESAEQDPAFSIEQVTQAALSRGIFVNTLYCDDNEGSVRPEWERVAALTQGIFASIDQDAAAVANIETPMDEELAQLNDALNETYVTYGKDGARYRDNQQAQDVNAEQMSLATAASRTVTKASALYNNAEWDLVDAVKSGKKIEEIDADQLPSELRAMSPEEREAYVDNRSKHRADLQDEIGKLDQKRRAYIEEKTKLYPTDGAQGLDEAMQESLRNLAEKKGFRFSKS